MALEEIILKKREELDKDWRRLLDEGKTEHGLQRAFAAAVLDEILNKYYSVVS